MQLFWESSSRCLYYFLRVKSLLPLPSRQHPILRRVVTSSPDDSAEPTPEYVAPHYSIGGIAFTRAMPTEATPVLIITNVDVNELTITVNTGYMQKPVGVDLYDFSFQFRLLRAGRQYVLSIAEDARLTYEWDGAELTRGLTELAEQVAAGYIACSFEAEDGVITALASTPWCERTVYDLLEPPEDATSLYVVARRKIHYPQLEDTTWYDDLGIPPERINVENAEFYWESDYFDEMAEHSFAGFQQWIADHGLQTLYIERDGEEIVRVGVVYIS